MLYATAIKGFSGENRKSVSFVPNFILCMFNLFSKSKPAARPDYNILGVDMHSHLLPGIDDGSPDIETSVQLIRGMMELGYKKFITTPHIMWEMYRNTPAIIQEKLEALKVRLKAEQIDVQIEAAAEYFLDDHFSKMLDQKEKLLTFGDNFILVEFSMASPPFDLKDILFELQMQGYQPIIAHPERYIYLESNKAFYSELKEAGHFLQLNILSLGGAYGRSVEELAHWLLKKGFYDFAGTDLHHARHLQGLSNPAISGPLASLCRTGAIQNQSLL